MAEDAVGLNVLAILQEMQPISAEIEIIEGGLAGLNLLPLLEQGGRVVFVDAVCGFTEPGHIVLLDNNEILNAFDQYHFDHEAGLAYLLAVLPKVCDGELPEEIVLVGLEGECTTPTIKRAAYLSMHIAAHGLKAVR